MYKRIDICMQNFILIFLNGFVGFVHLFDFILDMGVVEWSVPSELSQCIAGYEYSFEHSGISGVLPANTTMLPLYRFNINTPCNVDTLSIAPIFHVGPEPIRNSGIHGLISMGKDKYSVIIKVLK